VTITLAVLNVGVFGWQIAAGADVLSPSAGWIVEHGGNFAPLTLDGEPWRLLTSMFLHIGLLHLVMNMIGLVDGGRHVENMYGRAGFIAIYLVAGLAGSLASAMRGGVVSAGASGAIFGVFGAFGAFLLLHRKRLDPVEVGKQARGLLVFLAYNVYLGLAVQGIDLLAHAGGLAAGFACGIMLEYGTTEGRSTLVRALLVGAIGVGLTLAGAFTAPAPTGTGNAAMDAYNEAASTENSVMKRWRELATEIGAGKLTEAQFADAIEKELLPPWRAAADKFQREGGSSDIAKKMLGYLRAREEGWVLIVKGVRADDEKLAAQGLEKLKDADKLLQALNDANK
jgi:rhomboid protease GluP